MGAEAGVDNELASVIRFCKLKEKYSLEFSISTRASVARHWMDWAHRGEVVDVGHPETDELRGQLLCNDLSLP